MLCTICRASWRTELKSLKNISNNLCEFVGNKWKSTSSLGNLDLKFFASWTQTWKNAFESSFNLTTAWMKMEVTNLTFEYYRPEESFLEQAVLRK